MNRPLLALLALSSLVAGCHGGSTTPPVISQEPTTNIQPSTDFKGIPQTAMPAVYPADPPSTVRSSYARVGLAQIFDAFNDAHMTAAQIEDDASRYDVVWAAQYPAYWRAGNPSMAISLYDILEDDNISMSHHDLAWWKEYHPTWMLYACTADGAPTHDYAYNPGVGFSEVVLDIHNPSVRDYLINTIAIPFAKAHGYNALALDQVLLQNFLGGGNPHFGQTVKAGEYGCGVWNTNGTFTRVYDSPKVSNATWDADILDYLATAKAEASAAGMRIVVNHPPVLSLNAAEEDLIRDVNVTIDEGGFSDYGNYLEESNNYIFLDLYKYMEWVQKQGVAIVIIDRYARDLEPTDNQLEYAIGTYLMANEGNAELFVSGENVGDRGYGAENYHSEYAAALGDPCGAMYGGPSYSSTSPHIYYRRFTDGLVIVNSGSLPKIDEDATIPTNHVYKDMMSYRLHPVMQVRSNYALVLTTTGGTGCK